MSWPPTSSRRSPSTRWRTTSPRETGATVPSPRSTVYSPRTPSSPSWGCATRSWTWRLASHTGCGCPSPTLVQASRPKPVRSIRTGNRSSTLAPTMSAPPSGSRRSRSPTSRHHTAARPAPTKDPPEPHDDPSHPTRHAKRGRTPPPHQGPPMTTPTAAPGPAPTRISLLRVAIVLLCTALLGWTGTRAISAAVTTPPTPGPSIFAAYVDVTATPTYPFETPSGPAQSNVILSFVVAGPAHQCTATWGGAYTLDQAGSHLDLDRRMSQLRLVGGQARVSFGGQAGNELASTCTDPMALRGAYQSVVDRYGLTSIDLDLEGASLQDTAAAARRAAAIKDVQDHVRTAGRSLAVWLTLPVSATGLTVAGASVVAGMLSAGVDLAGVNGMTMDFSAVGTPTQPLSRAVIQASTALHAQVRTAFALAGQPLDDGQAWAKVGIVPMIGQNDVASEQFTLTDAVAVNEFARAQGV